MALEEIVPGVYGIGMGYVNAFFIVGEDSLTLVDSGLAKKKDTILGAVAGAGRQSADQPSRTSPRRSRRNRLADSAVILCTASSSVNSPSSRA